MQVLTIVIIWLVYYVKWKNVQNDYFFTVPIVYRYLLQSVQEGTAISEDQDVLLNIKAMLHIAQSKMYSTNPLFYQQLMAAERKKTKRAVPNLADAT